MTVKQKPIVKRDKEISETIENVRKGNLWPTEAMVCLEEIAQEYAKQFALQVATEAVEEVEMDIINNHGLNTYKISKLTLDRILKNIKTRLNDEKFR